MKPDLKAITAETPLRLAIAAAMAFPDGSMTESGLRKEAGRGRLVIERIAGKDYTTLQAIAEMRKLCRAQQKDRDFGSNRPDGPQTEGLSRPPFGASKTEEQRSAQESARMKLADLRQRLKQPSETTSTGRPRRARATVTHLRSGSQT